MKTIVLMIEKEVTKSFNDLEEIHQMAIAKTICKLIKARKPDVIKRIYALGNPELVLTLENDHVVGFRMANEQSKGVMKILFQNYIKEAL